MLTYSEGRQYGRAGEQFGQYHVNVDGHVLERISVDQLDDLHFCRLSIEFITGEIIVVAVRREELRQWAKSLDSN